jgi:hypothetical protein
VFNSAHKSSALLRLALAATLIGGSLFGCHSEAKEPSAEIDRAKLPTGSISSSAASRESFAGRKERAHREAYEAGVQLARRLPVVRRNKAESALRGSVSDWPVFLHRRGDSAWNATVDRYVAHRGVLDSTFVARFLYVESRILASSIKAVDGR